MFIKNQTVHLIARAFLAGVILLTPIATHAADATFFGPIVPPECNCENQLNPATGQNDLTTAPDYGCVLQTVQNIINFGISIGIIITVLYIAFAGFSFIVNATNPGKRTAARQRIWNGLIGLLLIFSSWLIVDFVMKTLYDGGTTANGITYGPWNAILADNNPKHRCIEAKLPVSITTAIVPGVSTEGQMEGDGSTTVAPVGSGCSPIPDSQLVFVDGYRLTIDTAKRYQAMKAAAAKDGVTLILSSGYRSPENQLGPWKANKCNVVGGKAVCAVRTAAIPCSLGGSGSNHTRGTAIDIKLNAVVYNWLVKNAAQYGFYNKLPGDRPHWSSTGR